MLHPVTSPREIHPVYSDDDASERVHNAFNETINAPNFLDKVHSRSERVAQIASDFGFGKLDPEAMRVAELYGVTEQLGSEDFKKKAYGALRLYRDQDNEWRSLTPDSDPDSIGERVYAVGIVADFGLIDNFLHDEKEKYLNSHQSTKYGNLIQDSHPTFPMIAPRKLCMLLSKNQEKYPECKGVQVEAFLIKAAAAFDSFRQALSTSDETLLQKALYEIEAFYAPVCELMGYDAFGMAMRSEAIKLRMIRKNETINGLSPQERIQKARNTLSEYPAERVVEIVDDMIHDVFDANPDRFTQNSVKNESDHGIAFGAGMILNESLLPSFDYVWRRKSEGALAKKYEKAGEPADIIGVTIIVDDVSDVQKIFSHILEKVEATDLDHVTKTVSQDRSTPYSAAGSLDFLGEMQKIMPHEVSLEARSRKNGYEVAKVTILHKTIVETNGLLKDVETPIEVMVMTKESRRNSRDGDAAHIKKYLSDAHLGGVDSKYNDLEDTSLDTEDLKELSDRRTSAKERGLTPMGLGRALQELKFIALSRPIQVGRHAAAAAQRS